MNLIVDIGNTRTKIALFEKNTLVKKAFWTDNALEELNGLLGREKIDASVLSVSGSENRAIETLLKSAGFFIRLDSGTPVPIINKYKTPQTLGVDRLAAIVGLYALNQKDPLNGYNVAIDTGTCVTYDFLSKNNEYRGGNISPGLRMRLQAMHHFTARLPLATLQNPESGFIGDDTDSALRYGALAGLRAEISGMILLWSKKLEPVRAVLCGGDAETIFNYEPLHNAFHEPDLTAIGLNYILNFNYKPENNLPSSP